LTYIQQFTLVRYLQQMLKMSSFSTDTPTQSATVSLFEQLLQGPGTKRRQFAQSALLKVIPQWDRRNRLHFSCCLNVIMCIKERATIRQHLCPGSAVQLWLMAGMANNRDRRRISIVFGWPSSPRPGVLILWLY